MKHSSSLTVSDAHRIHEAIHVVPNFPKSGIIFRDVMPVLGDPALFAAVVAALCEPYAEAAVTPVFVGVESRGFIFAAAMAQRLSAGFVPVRKVGKLPGAVDRVSYALEYGEAALEVKRGAIRQGEPVVVVDDLLATGGTVLAAVELVRRQGGRVVGLDFMVELEALEGRSRALQALGHTTSVRALFTY
jgi:adenine phosphoribosyltransferase